MYLNNALLDMCYFLFLVTIKFYNTIINYNKSLKNCQETLSAVHYQLLIIIVSKSSFH